jgi:hypothetical protein
MIGGGKAGGESSSGVGGIGVGSTHTSSLRSVESDEIVHEKSTTVGLVLCGRVLVPWALRDRWVVFGAAAASTLAALGGCT